MFFERDEYGYYILQSVNEFEGRTIQWRKYENSRQLKNLGGMYCIYCEETNQYKFYRNDYMRAHATPKFIRDMQAMKSIFDDYVER